MPTYYDDNFGHYEINDQEDIDFYHEMQRRSVEKECQGCGRKVQLNPDYVICNTCVEKMLRGENEHE